MLSEISSEIRTRIAVAEGATPKPPALGRAVRYVLFDIVEGIARGPFYRVRHDNPGEACDGHAELITLLYDCKWVIAGAVGPRMKQRLHACGIEVVATPEEQSAAVLAARFLAGTLVRRAAGSSRPADADSLPPSVANPAMIERLASQAQAGPHDPGSQHHCEAARVSQPAPEV